MSRHKSPLNSLDPVSLFILGAIVVVAVNTAAAWLFFKALEWVGLV